jgi:hypothetical protein
MSTFKPSPASVRGTPRENALSALRYIRKAALLLEKSIEGGAPVPGWVLGRITQAAGFLGSAVAYVKQSKGGRRAP